MNLKLMVKLIILKGQFQIAKTAEEFQSTQKVREMTQRCPKIIPWSNGTINESLMMRKIHEKVKF